MTDLNLDPARLKRTYMLSIATFGAMMLLAVAGSLVIFLHSPDRPEERIIFHVTFQTPQLPLHAREIRRAIHAISDPKVKINHATFGGATLQIQTRMLREDIRHVKSIILEKIHAKYQDISDISDKYINQNSLYVDQLKEIINIINIDQKRSSELQLGLKRISDSVNTIESAISGYRINANQSSPVITYSLDGAVRSKTASIVMVLSTALLCSILAAFIVFYIGVIAASRRNEISSLPPRLS